MIDDHRPRTARRPELIRHHEGGVVVARAGLEWADQPVVRRLAAATWPASGTRLYTQDGRRDSDRGRSCFQRSGVAFVERNVTRDPAAADELLTAGIFAPPLVRAGDHAIAGARLPVLAEALSFRCRCPAVGA